MSKQSPRMKSMFGGTPSGGFFDLPLQSPGDTGDADIVLLGAPAATPYASVGNYCAEAADAIRGAFGWPGVLGHHDFDIDGYLLPDGIRAIDWGNLDYSETDFAANRATIRDCVSKILAAKAIPLVLGGDDSVPIPVLEAYREHGPLTILQLDAHIDWRDDVNGETMGLSSNMRRASEMDWIENIIQVGARGIGSARPQDRQDALDWGVQFFPMRDVVQNGIDAIIDSIPENSNLYIALDIDVMDPAVVPAVIGPAPGGFSYWQILEIFEAVTKRARIAGFNLVELMPSADVGGRGALVAARLVAMIMGLAARQRHHLV
ncbi:MAG: arginase family protein [Gammaproteobacteria bacterium]|nr:arginase family protein [Gammaproteobacteria bacterium]